MAQTLSNFDAALKEFYLPRLQSTINTNRVLMTHLRRDASKTDASGRRAVVPVNIRPSQALGARGDGGALPTAQHQRYVEVRINYKFNYGTIQLTHPTIRASRNDRGAFIRVVGSEMDGIRRDLKNDVNRQLFSYGAGVLGVISSTNGTTTTMQRGHRVKANMLIDSKAGLVSTTLQVDGGTVTSVSGNTVNTTSAVGAGAAADYVFRDGAHGTSAGQTLEMMGLMGIIDSTTYVTTLFNISRSTYPEWAGQILANSGTGRDIDEDLLDQAVLDAQSNSEAELSLGITDPTVWRKIGQLMTPDRRYTPSMTLAGGFKYLEWSGIPIVWDRDCPVDDSNYLRQLFFLDMDTFAIYELADWDFDDTDGSILHRVTGYAKYDATLFYYAQLGCLDPANNVVIRDINY